MEEKEVVISIRRYSEALKLMVCKEHVEQGVGLSDLARKYRLSTHTIIYDWLRKYGYLPPRYKYNKPNIVQIGVQNYDSRAVRSSLLTKSYRKIPMFVNGLARQKSIP